MIRECSIIHAEREKKASKFPSPLYGSAVGLPHQKISKFAPKPAPFYRVSTPLGPMGFAPNPGSSPPRMEPEGSSTPLLGCVLGPSIALEGPKRKPHEICRQNTILMLANPLLRAY